MRLRFHYSTRFAITIHPDRHGSLERFGKYNVNRPEVMLAREPFPDNCFRSGSSHESYACFQTTNLEVRDRMTRPTYHLAGPNIVPPVRSRDYLCAPVSTRAIAERLPQIYGQMAGFRRQATAAKCQPGVALPGRQTHG